MENFLKTEIASEMGKIKRFRQRVKVFEQGRCAKSEFKALKQTYADSVLKLNQRFFECTARTNAEKQVLELIQQSTRAKFYTSLWIGNRNIDLFCPSIGVLYPPSIKGKLTSKHPVHRGLAIEVDGSIHDHELKMKKDASKFAMLEELGIGLITIRNDDLNKASVQNIINNLRNQSRLDTRARRRLWQKIYTATILFHADDEVLNQLYGKDFTVNSKLSSNVCVKGVENESRRE